MSRPTRPGEPLLAADENVPRGADRPVTSSVVRSSSVMALGTLASRGTGFLRTLVLVYVLGYLTVSDAYNNANTLPNAVYDLMMGGILTSVVVPLLVRAAKRDTDRGRAYDQRIFTLSAILLFGLTVVATLAAPLLIDLYTRMLPASASTRPSSATQHLMVTFAYFFVPQIFFYGMTSLIGGVLNARDRFAAPMWTPVLNNVVVIAVLLMFTGVGGSPYSQTITASQVRLLGLGTTLGIVVQTLALIPSLRAVGFRWRPRFDFRRAEVAEITRMAGPLFGYILTTQVAYLVVQNVCNATSTQAFPTYSYAFLLFQLPYAVVGISVITALLPRMSAHAAERRYSEVKSDFSGGVRLASVIVVPAALLLGVLGAPLAEALLAHGHMTVAEASYTGVVFGIFSLGLVPYMMFQLLLRVFYALHDSRTPMYIGVAVMAANIVGSLLSLSLLPPGQVVAGVAATFGFSNLVGTAIAWRVLSRRLFGLGGRLITRSLVRMHLAAIPGALLALLVTAAAGAALSSGFTFGLVTVVVGGTGGVALYVYAARVLRVREVTELLGGVRARLGR